MSPARSRRQQTMHRRERMEIVKAVVVSAAIVGVTVLVVWALRPGPAGVPATGGVMNRQPRASWLVFGAIVVGSIAVWYILRGSPRARRRAKVLLPIALVVVLLATVAAGIAWPGGLLRHEVTPSAEPVPEPTPLPTTPTTPPTAKTPKTTGASGTTGSTTPSTDSATTAAPTTPPR
jgi:hypothetical protein